MFLLIGRDSLGSICILCPVHCQIRRCWYIWRLGRITRSSILSQLFRSLPLRPRYCQWRYESSHILPRCLYARLHHVRNAGAILCPGLWSAHAQICHCGEGWRFGEFTRTLVEISRGGFSSGGCCHGIGIVSSSPIPNELVGVLSWYYKPYWRRARVMMMMGTVWWLCCALIDDITRYVILKVTTFQSGTYWWYCSG